MSLEFSQFQVSQVSKHRELRVRITLDGNIQESLESTLDAGVHSWREPFSFIADAVSVCEIHVLAKTRKFLCCAGRYKTIRTTRLQRISELLDTRGDDGAILLPLYDSTKPDPNGAPIGSVVFVISPNPSLNHLSTRDAVPCKEESGTASLSYPEAISEKPSSDSAASTSRLRSMAPTRPASLPSAPIHCPPNVPPQLISSPSPETLTPQYLQATAQLPQCTFGYSPQKSGVDRTSTEMDTYGDASVHPKYVFSPGVLPDEMTATSSLDEDDGPSGPLPQGSAEIGSFSPVICEPPDDMTCEPSETWSAVPLHTTESTFLPTLSEDFDHGTIPQISITLAKSSRGNSPLAPSTCDSDVTIKRPSVHVYTGSATQAMGVAPALSVSPGFVDEASPFSRSAILASPQPKTATTNTSTSCLSPFSRTSLAESPSTAGTTPAQSAVSDGKGVMTCPNTKPEKKRPTIDTSCVGPRGQVRKYRNGSVPPVHVPVKLRNASLDLPRYHEHEKFEPNPSMYSIAPSISPEYLKKKNGDLRCPSTQSPASRPSLAPSTRTRAPSIRREQLEFDEAQICLDTANLGDQEVATFLKEVDAALSAIVNGTPAVAADSRAFLAVPVASSRLVSRHQSRRPSSQHLRADLSATVRSHEKEGATRTDFSLVATSRASAHPSVIASRAGSPLSGHTETIPRLLLSQVDVTAASPSRSAVPASTFPLPQRVSPQPSSRQEPDEWVAPSFVSARRMRLSRPGSYYGDVNGNETSREVRLESP